jgi:hypothetical protein
MKIFNEGSGWDSMHDETLATLAMLEASEIHAALAKPLIHVLDTWDALDADWTAVERAAVRANARVAWINLELDRRTTVFGAQLLADCGANRRHPTYVRFFPEGVAKVVKMGLENQIGVMKKFPIIAGEIDLPKTSVAALKSVTAMFDAADKAILDREAATLNATRISVRVAAWRDEANRHRRTTETALADYANKNGLPRDYPNGFFAVQRTASARPDGNSGGTDGGTPAP